MKNQPPDRFIPATPGERKRRPFSAPVSKKPTYIYTEEDLGEGILEMGL